MNLELRRKTLLAIGWKAHPGMIYVEYYLQGHAEDAPAVESEPGLAITMLDEFCKARALHWTLEPDRTHSGKYVCMLLGDSIPDDVDIEPCAETIAEACCLAVIAAAEALKK